jgi:hypothetical protein
MIYRDISSRKTQTIEIIETVKMIIQEEKSNKYLLLSLKPAYYREYIKGNN